MRAVAAQTYPAKGAMTCVAVNDRHAPIRILPRIVKVTERHNGVPGAIAWTSQRRAGSGRSATVDGSNPGWPRPRGSASRAHSARSERAARGTGGSTAGRLGFGMNASFGPNVDRQRDVTSRPIIEQPSVAIIRT
jgi:hypothetical protein